MPHSSSHPSTKEVLNQISDCQKLLNKIHDTLAYTQAYGLPVPPSTLQTWRIITDRLDCLSYRWELALEKKTRHPTNIFCSLECKATVTTLRRALEQAREYQGCAADSEDNGKKSTEERYRMLQRFGSSYSSWGNANDVEAYRALCTLQRYTEGRGWAAEDDFGITWSDKELREREEVSEKHILDVTGRIQRKYMWGSVHGTGF